MTLTTDERSARIAGRAAGLRSRPGTEGSRDRWLLVVGGVLLPLGLLLVMVGWFGSSSTPLVFEQVPYVVSGGLLGLGLVVAGGFVYFSYWQTLLVRDGRQQQAHLGELSASVLRIEALLASSLTGRGLSTTDRFVATATGTMLHRPDCPSVVGSASVREVSPDAPGLTACGMCRPLEAHR